MFSIDCLEIFDACDKSLRKNLIPGKFFFNNRYDEDGRQFDESLIKKIPKFWEDKINVQAIVGKNGSGKSTLLDLMYMAINNFAYMYNRNDESFSHNWTYVPGVFVSLHYSIGYNSYVIKCKDYYVELDANNCCIFRAAINSGEDFPSIDEINCAQSDIVEKFFFSSVSNFSMQSYQPTNYYLQKAYVRENSAANPDRIVCNDWLNHCFHKNDGYKTPIVINPDRLNGCLDISRLMQLSKDQSASLFIFSKKKSFFDPYVFYRLDVRDCVDVYKKAMVADRSNVWQYVENKTTVGSPIRDWFDDFFEDILNKTLTRQIVNFFDISSASGTSFYKNCIAYLVFKIWKIIKTAPLYKDYFDYIQIRFDEYTFRLDVVLGDGRTEADLLNLLNFLKEDSSYVTKKVRRTINFLKLAEGSLDKLNSTDFFKIFENTSVFYNGETLTPSIIDSALPPPVFDYDLKLTKLDVNDEPVLIYSDRYIVERKDESFFYYDENNQHVKIEDVENIKILEIDYRQLSSGEIQLIQTISTHLYHVMNLISSLDSASKYKCFNMIFDEVEISFHPEYQRLFISRLISALTAMNVNSSHFINIFIVTHSPFLLSDIPLKQILFLEEGTAKKKIMNTFAGNIGEMMYDSFFMKSTIGEFSEEKLKRIIKIKQGKNPDEKKDDGTLKLLSETSELKRNELLDECDVVLNYIGDPIFRNLIKEIGKTDGV